MLITILFVVGTVILIVAILLGLDRLLLWMERRGWIYWRKSKSSGTGIGNALLEIQSMLGPSRKNIVEVMKEDKREQEDSGAPPRPKIKTSLSGSIMV